MRELLHAMTKERGKEEKESKGREGSKYPQNKFMAMALAR